MTSRTHPELRFPASKHRQLPLFERIRENRRQPPSHRLGRFFLVVVLFFPRPPLAHTPGPRALALLCRLAAVSIAVLGLHLLLPKLIEEFEGDSASALGVLLLSSVPYTASVVGNVCIAASTSRLGVNSRFPHLLFAVFLVVLGFLISALFKSATVKIFGLAVTGAGLWGNYGPLWR